MKLHQNSLRTINWIILKDVKKFLKLDRGYAFIYNEACSFHSLQVDSSNAPLFLQKLLHFVLALH